MAYALVMQLAFGLATGNWWIGAAFGSAFFIGREHAQAEYRYIEANGGSRYKTPLPPEFAVFNMKYWDRDSLLDWISPLVAVVAIAVACSHW